MPKSVQKKRFDISHVKMWKYFTYNIITLKLHYSKCYTETTKGKQFKVISCKTIFLQKQKKYDVTMFRQFKCSNRSSEVPIYQWSILFLDKSNSPGTKQNPDLWRNMPTTEYSTTQHAEVMLRLLNGYKTLLEAFWRWKRATFSILDGWNLRWHQKWNMKTNIAIKQPVSEDIRLMEWWSHYFILF